MKGLEMVKCKSLRINMLRITHTGKSVNFPVTIAYSLSYLLRLSTTVTELITVCLSLFTALKHFLQCGGHICVFILLFLLCGLLFTGVCKLASCACQGGTCLYCFPQFLISIPASLANKMLTMHQR